MARGKSIDDAATLQMALVGYQIEKQRIESRMQEIQSQLRGRRSAGAAGSTGAPKAAGGRRELSEAARARIAAAQKRRWAEYRKKAAKGKTSAPKVAAAS